MMINDDHVVDAVAFDVFFRILKWLQFLMAHHPSSQRRPFFSLQAAAAAVAQERAPKVGST